MEVVKTLHTDNKQQIRKWIQSPSKCRSDVTFLLPLDVYHRPNLERAHKGRLPACFDTFWLHKFYTTFLTCPFNILVRKLFVRLGNVKILNLNLGQSIQVWLNSALNKKIQAACGWHPFYLWGWQVMGLSA